MNLQKMKKIQKIHLESQLQLLLHLARIQEVLEQLQEDLEPLQAVSEPQIEDSEHHLEALELLQVDLVSRQELLELQMLTLPIILECLLPRPP